MNTNHLPRPPLDASEHLQPSAPPDLQLAHLCLADVASQQVQWLWSQRLPLGKLTLLEGSPGSGTSLFALHLAACLSAGSPWPDGTPCPQGNVLLIAPHDSVSDTIKPRLEAAGADTSHIFFLPHIADTSASPPRRSRPFSLPQDLALLESTLLHLHIRLLILDPFSTIPGLRHCLLDLVQLAERTGCAIMLTCSLKQPPTDPLRAQSPVSPALTTARSHLLLAPDPAHEHQHLLLTPRHPLCASPSILSYEIVAPEHGIPTLHWLGQRDPSHLTLLSTGPIHSSQRQSILRFLHESPTARTINDILQAASYDYEAGRKMIMRMRMAGELVSPARGLYTTSAHPCLASFSASSSQPDLTPSPVPNVPSSDNSPALPSLELSPPDPTPSPVPNVPSSDNSPDTPSLELSPANTVPASLSTSAIPPTAAFARSSNHVPIVPSLSEARLTLPAPTPHELHIVHSAAHP